VIHLDTGFLIYALVRGSREDKMLRRWLRAGEQLGMCTVAWSEFLCRPLEQKHLDLALQLIVERPAFAEAEAALAAKLFNVSGRRRGSFADCMIAAAAIVAQAPLATSNAKDFRRLEKQGLDLRSA
jgi:predicted nucleic acid-binding protein